MIKQSQYVINILKCVQSDLDTPQDYVLAVFSLVKQLVIASSQQKNPRLALAVLIIDE